MHSRGHTKHRKTKRSQGAFPNLKLEHISAASQYKADCSLRQRLSINPSSNFGKILCIFVTTYISVVILEFS
jgi:hypothetical protein